MHPALAVGPIASIHVPMIYESLPRIIRTESVDYVSPKLSSRPKDGHSVS